MKTTRLAFAVPLLLACSAAHAVSVSPRGTGQVLLFPYYTVDGGQQTLLTIANPTDRARALRVRFAEARNGKTVLSLNVYLGARDAWTAAVFGDGGSGAARLVSFDRSCALVPPATLREPGTVTTFSTAAYTGANRDFDPATTPPARVAALAAPERTRSGFIEVIEMGRLRSGTGPLELGEEVATSCVALQAAWTDDNAEGWRSDPTRAIDLPFGGLYGHAAVVDVADGAMLSYAATALDRFYTVAAAPGALHAPPDSARPALDDARNSADSVTAVIAPADSDPAFEVFPVDRAIDAVSLALMNSIAYGEFNIEPALAAATEWVIATPTRPFYVDVETDGAVRAPFTDAFRDDGRSDEQVRIQLRDREGRGLNYYCAGCSPLPFPPPLPVPVFGNAVDIVAFGDSLTPPARTAVFDAVVGETASWVPTRDYDDALFRTGWASLRFDDPTTIPAENVLTGPTSGTVYRGLPAIGFAVTRFENQNVTPGVLANFGDASPLANELLRDAPASGTGGAR